jgi:DNA repair protein RecO (recombination protein O)
VGLKRSVQTRGIILNKRKQGEADDLIILYSPDLGKIRALSKGSRKILSSFCGHLDTLNICQFQLYKTAYRYTITQAVTQNSFKQIRQNFEISVLAALILEIFQKSVSFEEEEQSQELFNLLENSLHLLLKVNNPSLALESFKLNFLELLGILPNMTNCSFCRQFWNESQKIAFNKDGNLICQNCQKPNEFLKNIDLKIIKLIHFLLKGGLERQKLKISKEEQNELQSFINIFLYPYLGSEIHGQKILGLNHF